MTNLQTIKEAIRSRGNKDYSNYMSNDDLLIELRDIAYHNDLDFMDIFDDLIELEELEEMAQYELENGGLIRLKYFLGQLSNNTYDDMFYILDGYANAKEVELSDIEHYAELIEEMIEEDSE